MSLRVFWILCFALVASMIGKAAEPPKESGPVGKPPTMSQKDWAKSVLKGRKIENIDPKELPKPDPNIDKYVLTDDPVTVVSMIKEGRFVPKYKESWVKDVERNTAYRLTVQDHWNEDLFCVQRIRIYEEDTSARKLPIQTVGGNPKTPPTTGGSSPSNNEGDQGGKEGFGGSSPGSNNGKQPEDEKNTKRVFKKVPREDLLVKCEGGYRLKTHTRYRFSFTNAIHFYGAHRIIYKIHRGKKSAPFCHERTYTIAGRRDKRLDIDECEAMIERIFTWQGAIKNFFWTLLHNPISVFTGRTFYEK